ncbi:MAG: hypothetical protein ACT4PJ_16700 [Gemmatimonadaceae bacterium]
MLVLWGVGIPALWAQQPGSPGQTPSQLPLYRSPALALVQPAAGGSVPGDKPVVIFRYGPGEPNDPIDVRSFAVAVDGHDRTHLFQVSALEAWGPLAPHESSLETGPHQIAARICSSRGACADVSATILIVPAVIDGGDPNAPSAPRRRKVLDAVLDALRKILVP